MIQEYEENVKIKKDIVRERHKFVEEVEQNQEHKECKEQEKKEVE